MGKNKVVYGGTTIMDITDTTAETQDVVKGRVFYAKSGDRSIGTADYMEKVSDPTANNVLLTDANGQAIDSNVSIDDIVCFTDIATGTTYGLVKLNPSESVTINANGQLVVGGRLGQFQNGGVYYPVNIAPTNVGASSFLMSDGAKT